MAPQNLSTAVSSTCSGGEAQITTHILLACSTPPVVCTIADAQKWNRLGKTRSRKGWYPEQARLDGCVAFQIPGA